MSSNIDDAHGVSTSSVGDAVSRLRAWLDALDREHGEARALKAADIRSGGYYFGISGASVLEGTDVAFIENPSSQIQISRVTSRISQQALSEALHPQLPDVSALLFTLFRRVGSELYISETVAREFNEAVDFAKRLTSLIQIRTGRLMGLVYISTAPLCQMAAHHGDLLVAAPFGYERKPHLWASERAVHSKDLEWALLRMLRCERLYKSEASFRLAFDAASDSPFSGDARAAIARIWSGIESLFDVQSELSYRLSMYAAALLSDDLRERISAQREFKRLYNLRSKAVHGAKMSDEALSRALVESWAILCDLLIACIDSGPQIPSPETLDGVLLGALLQRDGGIEYPTVN